jgi:6-phosphofructokinase 1
VILQMDGLRVVVLFSGAGVPGMNALLRSIVRLGLNRHRADVLGARNGFGGLVRTATRLEHGQVTEAGLITEIESCVGLPGLLRGDLDVVRLDHGSVSGLLGVGGSILGAARCGEFRSAAVRRQVIGLLEKLNVDAVIVCGGDGSLAGAGCLASESDLRVVGVPATIDGELPMTEMALGVDSAVNALTQAVSHFGKPAVGHHRVMVLEVMGRNNSELARMAALALGAEIVVTPERGALNADRILGIAQCLERRMLKGRRHAIVLVAEEMDLDPALGSQRDSNPSMRLAHEIQAYFHCEGSPFPDLEARASVQGHLLRGGSPSVADRILAARFAEAAWRAIVSPGEQSGVLGLRQGMILLQDFEGPADPERTETADRLYQLQKDVSKR